MGDVVWWLLVCVPAVLFWLCAARFIIDWWRFNEP